MWFELGNDCKENSDFPSKEYYLMVTYLMVTYLMALKYNKPLLENNQRNLI